MCLFLRHAICIGGRVWSTNPWGAPTDLGASWIHNINYNPIAALAKKYHIDTTATIFSSDTLEKKFTSFDVYDNKGKKIDPIKMHAILELSRKFNLAIEQHSLNLNDSATYADAVSLFAQQENLKSEELQLFNFFVQHMFELEYAADCSKLQ